MFSVVVPGKSYAAAAGGSNLSGNHGMNSHCDYSSIDATEELCPYALAGECRYGSACDYIHGEQCDLCGYQCLHPYNEHQRKEHRKVCFRAILVRKICVMF